MRPSNRTTKLAPNKIAALSNGGGFVLGLWAMSTYKDAPLRWVKSARGLPATESLLRARADVCEASVELVGGFASVIYGRAAHGYSLEHPFNKEHEFL
jgi:hypothetical protein